MMEVEYRREMNRNYMVIRSQTTGNETYAIRMLSGNRIQGLLQFQDKNINGDVKYYYDITSRQPLSRILEHRNLSGDELKELVSELLYTLKQLERYFLDEGQLCFQPDYIYVEPATFKASFCLIPGRRTEFAAELCELSQYLLDHVNQSDGEAVVLAFSIFKECRKLNFGMEDIERCLRQQDHSKIGEGEQRESRHTESRQAEVRQIDIKKIEASSDVGIRADNGKKNSLKHEITKIKRARGLGQEFSNQKETCDLNHDFSKQNTTDGHRMEEKEIPMPVLAVLGISIILMILIPAHLFFMLGFEWFRSNLWMIAIGEIAVIFILAAILILLKVRKHTDYESEETDEEPWEVYFHEINEEEERIPEETELDDSDDEDFQTVLLSARPIDKESRRLVSVNGGDEIAVGYYPFLIGKSRDLTDHCLNKPGVSRLHIKIEETETGYLVTDLNSTNGTAVNGNLLQANGTAPLSPGDELTIGAERYYFR